MTSAAQWQADQLAAAARRDAAAPDRWWGTVETVNTDDTVTVSGLGATRTSVRCVASYWPRVTGDRVLVQTTTAGPVVVGTIATPTESVQLAGVTVANADPPTGAGWLVIVAGSVWANTSPTRLWVKAASAPAPPAASASFLTVAATAMGTYRGGALRHMDYAEQGQYAGAVGYGNQTGVFWLPPGGFASLSAKTPTRVVASARRRSADHGNSFGLVPVTVWTHAGQPGQQTTPALTGPGAQIGKARLGESATGDLATSLAAGFIAGTTTGIAIYDDAILNNIEADDASVTIYYT